MNASTITAAQLSQVDGMSLRDAAKVLGVGKSSIQRARERRTLDKISVTAVPPIPSAGYRFEQAVDGTVDLQTRATEEPQEPTVLEQLLKDKGIDPATHSVSYGYSEWEAQGPEGSVRTLHSTRVRATPKPTSKTPKLDSDDLLRALDGYDGSQIDITGVGRQDSTFVICPSDMQIGKTSYNGGTQETVQRVRASVEKARRFLAANPQQEIIIAELGDPLENFYNTSSQRETNDLDITGQIRVARRLLLDIIKTLAPYAPKVTYITVPSNHGSVRVGFKAQAGDSHNDWGLEISNQLEDAVRENPTLSHVGFVRPERLRESLSYESSNTNLGFVHGHQSRSAEKLGEWWKGQVHGRGPVKDSDILLSGHWHSFRVQQSGDRKWIMVSPAQDPGSDWFTELTGESSETGMLSFTTRDGKWDNLTLL